MSVLAAYVDRADGRAALAFAVTEASRRGTKLHVAHFQVTELASPAASAHAFSSRQQIQRITSELADSGVEVEVHARFTNKLAANGILTIAEEVDAEVIVIGLRPRSPVGKLLLGSVARDVLLQSSVPVVAVPVAP